MYYSLHKKSSEDIIMGLQENHGHMTLCMIVRMELYLVFIIQCLEMPHTILYLCCLLELK